MADPEDLINQEQAFDHLLARHRGERVRELTNLLLSALHAHGVLVDLDRVRPIAYGVLVDWLYHGASVDIDPRA